ncbi:hypothetical protein ABZ897_05845 [Nonomuraea sp. NPDC046802]|uniref:hypothetical protein n=1 Tax=Nonomuraea sp. NPDC046802 TaxID=3154919 RepID=UPI0033D8ABFA
MTVKGALIVAGSGALVLAVLTGTIVGVAALAPEFLPGGAGWQGDATIGKAAPDGVVELPRLRNGSILAAKRWPSACELVNEEDVKAILPDAEDVRAEPGGSYVVSIEKFAADPEWRESNNAEAGQCLYTMRLPGEVYEATTFWVRIEAVAAPELIAAYSQDLGGVNTNQGDHGADRCVLKGAASGNWFCHKGPVLFTVGGHTTATFDGFQAPAPFFWRDEVLPQFVQTVSAKIK